MENFSLLLEDLFTITPGHLQRAARGEPCGRAWLNGVAALEESQAAVCCAASSLLEPPWAPGGHGQ